MPTIEGMFTASVCVLYARYPIILSIENHCSVTQQAKMASGFMDVFGDTLLTEPIPSCGGLLPTPNQLKRKIIIKVRKQHMMTFPKLTNFKYSIVTVSQICCATEHSTRGVQKVFSLSYLSYVGRSMSRIYFST